MNQVEHLCPGGDRRGDAVVVPRACGRWRLEGAVEAILCRPPSPAEGR